MKNESEKKRIAVALGDFDGMHLAHKTVITGADDAIIYSVHNRFSLLQKSIFEKRFPNAIFPDFNEIKNMSPEQFVDEVLINQLGAGIILCGFNFRFGKNALWSALDLRQYLESKNVWVRILEHQDFKGEPISSTRIRKCIQDGEIEFANEMLGYSFTFENEVVKGDQRGRTIDFPTINQQLPDGLIIPKFGVYESRCFVGDKEYKSFTNIGVRPTWLTKEPMAETHIFDFNGDLYGKVIRVELVRYLREEKVFLSLDDLKDQLIYDKGCII